MSLNQTSKTASRFSAAIIATVAFATVAEARPSTREFSCGNLQAFVADRGAVVMSHRSRNLYQRFVNSRFYCEIGERPANFFVPSATGVCRLKICKDVFRRRN